MCLLVITLFSYSHLLCICGVRIPTLVYPFLLHSIFLSHAINFYFGRRQRLSFCQLTYQHIYYFALILTKYASQEAHVHHSFFHDSKALQAEYSSTGCSAIRSHRSASFKCSGKQNYVSAPATYHSIQQQSSQLWLFGYVRVQNHFLSSILSYRLTKGKKQK